MANVVEMRRHNSVIISSTHPIDSAINSVAMSF